MHLFKRQDGFSVLEAVLVVLLLLAIGGVGYFAYQAHKNTTNGHASAALKKSPDQQSTASSSKATSSPLVAAGCTIAPPSFKPTSITLACADANIVAVGLTWNTWDATQAVGQGSVQEKDCTPDCADGHDVTYPAHFVLSAPKQAASTAVFSVLTVIYSGSFPGSSSTEVYPLTVPSQ